MCIYVSYCDVEAASKITYETKHTFCFKTSDLSYDGEAVPQYKYGKIEKTMDLKILDALMKRVDNIDRCGYPADFIKSLIATFYWTGFRRSEVIGDKGNKWKLKSGKTRSSKPFPGLLKENIKLDDEFVYIHQVARKHGSREGPVVIPRILPYVDLIVKHWQNCQEGAKLFPISSVTFWRIMKRIDPKIYPHYFILNRVTKMCEDPENSLQDICRWTGKSPITIAKYLAKVGRYSKQVGSRMLKEN